MNPTPPRRYRTEPQKVKRRLHILERRAAYLAKVMADQVKWSSMDQMTRNHFAAEHGALVWAVGYLLRHSDAVFNEARLIEEANSTNIIEVPHAPSV